MSLLNKMVKLAYDKPELRKKLLPLLKNATKEKTFEQYVPDLENALAQGKKQFGDIEKEYNESKEKYEVLDKYVVKMERDYVNEAKKFEKGVKEFIKDKSSEFNKSWDKDAETLSKKIKSLSERKYWESLSKDERNDEIVKESFLSDFTNDLFYEYILEKGGVPSDEDREEARKYLIDDVLYPGYGILDSKYYENPSIYVDFDHHLFGFLDKKTLKMDAEGFARSNVSEHDRKDRFSDVIESYVGYLHKEDPDGRAPRRRSDSKVYEKMTKKLTDSIGSKYVNFGEIRESYKNNKNRYDAGKKNLDAIENALKNKSLDGLPKDVKDQVVQAGRERRKEQKKEKKYKGKIRIKQKKFDLTGEYSATINPYKDQLKSIQDQKGRLEKNQSDINTQIESYKSRSKKLQSNLEELEEGYTRLEGKELEEAISKLKDDIKKNYTDPIERLKKDHKKLDKEIKKLKTKEKSVAKKSDEAEKDIKREKKHFEPQVKKKQEEEAKKKQEEEAKKKQESKSTREEKEKFLKTKVKSPYSDSDAQIGSVESQARRKKDKSVLDKIKSWWQSFRKKNDKNKKASSSKTYKKCRNVLIKFAYDNPQYRKELLPMLKDED